MDSIRGHERLGRDHDYRSSVLHHLPSETESEKTLGRHKLLRHPDPVCRKATPSLTLLTSCLGTSRAVLYSYATSVISRSTPTPQCRPMFGNGQFAVKCFKQWLSYLPVCHTFESSWSRSPVVCSSRLNSNILRCSRHTMRPNVRTAI